MRSNILAHEHKLDVLFAGQFPGAKPSAGLPAAAHEWSAAIWEEAVKLGPLALTPQQLSRGLALAEHPVYICGVHRSGTTLFQNLLDGHPSLVVLPSEGTFYTVLESKLTALHESERMAFLASEWIRRLANPTNQPPYWLLGRSTAQGSPYVDFARYLISWWNAVDHKKNQIAPHLAVVLAYATCTGNLHAKYWVDKTPANERFLARIWKETPEAKVIHMLREPVATLNSRKLMEPSLDLHNVLADMKISFRIANRPPPNDNRYMLLHYEDLCDKPRAIVEKLALFLDIPVTASLNQPTVAGMPVKANSMFANTSTAGKILKPHQHRQITRLSATEHIYLAAYLTPLARKLNYPLMPIGSPRRLGILLKHALPRMFRYTRQQFQLYFRT